MADKSRGARSRLSAAFVDALAADWAEHGDAVLAKVRTENPATYAKLVAELVPKQVEAAPQSEFSAMSDEELDAWLIEKAEQIAKRPILSPTRRQLMKRNGTS
jgi:hypothetical protein